MIRNKLQIFLEEHDIPNKELIGRKQFHEHLNNTIKNGRVYISIPTVINDFLSNLGFQTRGHQSHDEVFQELKKRINDGFRQLFKEFMASRKIEKYNRRTYKIIKKVE